MAQAPPYPDRPIGYHVNRVGRRIQHQLVALVEAHGLDYPVEFWPALNRLCTAGGALSQNELADYLVRDKATIARLLARMERDGYVRRGPDPEDGRLKRVRVTPGGRRVAEAIRCDVHGMIGTSTRGIPEASLATCLDVLDAIFDNLAPRT